MKQERRRALVTGGAGFLGPHLIKRLLQDGWAVSSLDNFARGPRRHLEPFRSDSNFASFEGGIEDAAFVAETIERSRPEVIFHLAALHFIPYCIAHPAETLEVNVKGTQCLLDATFHAPARRFILASTADVYAPSDEAHAEGGSLGSPNIYGRSKEFCEQLLVLARNRCPEKRFLAMRLFNIYGPGETNPHVLPDIVACLRKGRTLRLGNIQPRRDYVFVTDVVEALLCAADYSGKQHVFNVASGQSRSVRELVSILETVVGMSITIETDPAKLRPTERQNLSADIRLAREELGWEPRVGIKEGLASTLREEMASASFAS